MEYIIDICFQSEVLDQTKINCSFSFMFIYFLEGAHAFLVSIINFNSKNKYISTFFFYENKQKIRIIINTKIKIKTFLLKY